MARTVLLVGCGNMGFAMLKGWLDGMLEPGQALVVEPNEGLRERAAGVGATVFASPADMPEAPAPDLAIIAIKPQMMDAVLPDYARWGNGSTTFLSIAAGTRIAAFEAALGEKTPVMRCMPNTPAAIGKGMMVCCSNAHVPDEVAGLAAKLLSAIGDVASIDSEDLMDAVTAISGSGPAYFFHFIECLAAAGEKLGLPADLALRLASQTANGAGALAAQSSDDPATLRRQVTSPGGTTAAALEVFMDEDRLMKLVGEATAAAETRGRELGG